MFHKNSFFLLVFVVFFLFSSLDLSKANAQNITFEDNYINSNHEDYEDDDLISLNDPVYTNDDDVYVIDNNNIDSDDVINESPLLKDFSASNNTLKDEVINKSLLLKTSSVSNNTLKSDVTTKGFTHSKIFKKKYSKKYWGKKKRASKFLPNCSKSPASKAVAYTRTETWSANVSLSTDDLSYIKPTLGYTFSKSESFAETTTVTVKPGHIGWIDFTPLKYKAVGTLTYTFDSMPLVTKNVTMYSPKRLNKALDGADVTMSRKMTSDEKKRFCK